MNDSRDRELENRDTEPSSVMFDRLRTLVVRRDEMWWEIGQILDEMAVREDVGAAQTSYVENARSSGLTADDAHKFRRVAHHFSRNVAMRHDIDKLDAMLDFLRSMPCTMWGLDPLGVSIPVTGESGETRRVPFEDASTQQILEAAANARSQSAATNVWLPPDVARARDLLAEAMLERLEPGEVSVKIHRDVNEAGTYTLAIEGIDPFNAEAVGEVLKETSAQLLELATVESQK